MENIPSWLPDMVSVDGTWEDVLLRLYAIFERDIKNGNPILSGCLVWHDRRKIDGDKYEEGFWHLIERKNKEMADRQFDPRRSERLPWCRPTITNSNASEVLFWDYKFPNKKNPVTYLWLENYDYVIILEKRLLRIGTIYFLKSAYHVDGEKTRRQFRKRYDNRV